MIRSSRRKEKWTFYEEGMSNQLASQRRASQRRALVVEREEPRRSACCTSSSPSCRSLSTAMMSGTTSSRNVVPAIHAAFPVLLAIFLATPAARSSDRRPRQITGASIGGAPARDRRRGLWWWSGLATFANRAPSRLRVAKKKCKWVDVFTLHIISLSSLKIYLKPLGLTFLKAFFFLKYNFKEIRQALCATFTLHKF